MNNIGATLPDEVGAIYNAGLSPLFYTRSGRDQDGGGRIIVQRGFTSRLWTMNISDGGGAYFLDVSNINVLPNHNHGRIMVHSLRCLVSTNNRIIINLVSDAISSDQWSNAGVSLPGENRATYNAGLSPLFFGRVATAMYWKDAWIFAVSGYGLDNEYYGSTAHNSMYAYRFYNNVGGIIPSAWENHIIGMSLRCLVSTNNR